MSVELKEAFHLLAKEAFFFLEKEDGFQVREDYSGSVEYYSKYVKVCISYDWNRSFELGVGIGRLWDERTYSLDEISRFLGSTTLKSLVPMIVEKESLEDFLQYFAVYVQNECQDFLRGSDEQYRNLRKWSDKEASAYTIQIQLDQARLRAGKAWQEKRYIDFILAMDPYIKYLNPSELKKLEISRKRVCS